MGRSPSRPRGPLTRDDLTAPDLPPGPGKTPAIGRDYEYIRHGAVSILAGIDLHSGHISKETMAYLGTRPGRFQYMPTPKHGSWLNASPVMLRWNKFDRGVA